MSIFRTLDSNHAIYGLNKLKYSRIWNKYRRSTSDFIEFAESDSLLTYLRVSNSHYNIGFYLHKKSLDSKIVYILHSIKNENAYTCFAIYNIEKNEIIYDSTISSNTYRYNFIVNRISVKNKIANYDVSEKQFLKYSKQIDVSFYDLNKLGSIFVEYEPVEVD